MAIVPFEIIFKAFPSNEADYDAVKARIDNVDLASIGQNAAKLINDDDDPENFVISIKITGENTPPT